MKKSNHPQWALNHKRPGTELRLIRGKYYLYEYKTVYDKQRKGPRKISGKLLGSITENGFVPSGKRQLENAGFQIPVQKQRCKKYGVSLLVAQIFNKYIQAL